MIEQVRTVEIGAHSYGNEDEKCRTVADVYIAGLVRLGIRPQEIGGHEEHAYLDALEQCQLVYCACECNRV